MGVITPGGGGSEFLRTRVFVLVDNQVTKWVLTHDGQIVWFATFMTAEVYRLVAQFSLLGPLFAAEQVGLYPIATSPYSSTTLYQVSYHIQ